MSEDSVIQRHIDEVADKVLRQIEKVINNSIPTESCPQKKEKVEWKREQVLEKVKHKLSQNTVGPSEIKS